MGCLVITRKNDESFTIGDNVKVTIVETKWDRVRIAIEAPKDVLILRSELTQQERPNNEVQ